MILVECNLLPVNGTIPAFWDWLELPTPLLFAFVVLDGSSSAQWQRTHPLHHHQVHNTHIPPPPLLWPPPKHTNIPRELIFFFLEFSVAKSGTSDARSCRRKYHRRYSVTFPFHVSIVDTIRLCCNMRSTSSSSSLFMVLLTFKRLDHLGFLVYRPCRHVNQLFIMLQSFFF